MPHCFSCGQELIALEPVGRGEACGGCRADVRCCQNCEYYDPLAYNECRETVAERVIEKDRSNFCSFFRLGRQPGSGVIQNKSIDAKKKLEEIFKKK